MPYETQINRNETHRSVEPVPICNNININIRVSSTTAPRSAYVNARAGTWHMVDASINTRLWAHGAQHLDSRLSGGTYVLYDICKRYDVHTRTYEEVIEDPPIRVKCSYSAISRCAKIDCRKPLPHNIACVRHSHFDAKVG